MAKGLFTQCACVLFSAAPPVEAVQAVLSPLSPEYRRNDDADWAIGGTTLVIPLDSERGGRILVDVVDRTWPDEMGHPEDDPTVFVAWHAGAFGPFAFPGALERACDQAWHWGDAPFVARRHKAFVRIRASWVRGEQDPVLPDDYAPRDELDQVTRVAGLVLSMPDALAYFNPNAETLLPAPVLADAVRRGDDGGPPPLEAWANIRLMRVSDEWLLVDTVGHAQLDLPDVEACLPEAAHDPADMDQYLRNIALYLMAKGDVFGPGDTLDGPDASTWRVTRPEEPLSDPPRAVIRLVRADIEPPGELG